MWEAGESAPSIAEQLDQLFPDDAPFKPATIRQWASRGRWKRDVAQAGRYFHTGIVDPVMHLSRVNAVRWYRAALAKQEFPRDAGKAVNHAIRKVRTLFDPGEEALRNIREELYLMPVQLDTADQLQDLASQFVDDLSEEEAAILVDAAAQMRQFAEFIGTAFVSPETIDADEFERMRKSQESLAVSLALMARQRAGAKTEEESNG